MNTQHHGLRRLSWVGVIVTLGIVFGDIGTSPLYVMKAIIGSSSHIDVDFILGALSCVIWTLTLQTTLKYVIITLRADNNGEGGIMALYALIRRYKKKSVFLIAIIGASALIADGIITPSITVMSAVEGLHNVYLGTPVIPIVLIILLVLFTIQKFGTQFIGKSFGPIMFFWFMMLFILGFIQLIQYPAVLKAFNPYYAINLLVQYPNGFLLLGAVFLCTTGAEALYSDLGHCGIKNIQVSWIFVKISLIVTYLGQGAWILTHTAQITENTNPFFAIMPSWFLLPGIIMATTAAVIASQALITGAFTIFSESMSLNFWPRQKIKYPTIVKGQMYIPFVNWFLFWGCVIVVFYFQDSSKMEAAYGLSITITMLMTTLLLVYYLRIKRFPKIFVYAFMVAYLTIEGSFLIANLFKFMHGGWITIFIAGVLAVTMYVWYEGRIIKKRYMLFSKLKDYTEVITDLSKDVSISKFATNLVYMSRADYSTDIENKLMYSIINRPKRADHYWFVHVNYVNEPKTFEYSFEVLVPGIIYRVEFRLGFKIQPQINLFFRQVIQDLSSHNEFNYISGYDSLNKHNIPGDFKYIVVSRIHNMDHEFNFIDKIVMNLHHSVSKIGISTVNAFGLDSTNVITEMIPLVINGHNKHRLKRVD